MRRVLVVVEGQTESTFLTRLLAKHLANHRVAMAAPILGRAGHKGGVVHACGGCEAIDDRPNTQPAARIAWLFPTYKKGRSDKAHAPMFAERMQLETVRAHCPHFDRWLTRIESLQPA